MSETTQEERDHLRIELRNGRAILVEQEPLYRVLYDLDRLADIERDLSKLANTMDDMLPSTPEVGSANKYWAGKIRAILDPPEGN